MANLKKNPGASEAQVKSLHEALGMSLPQDYIAFLIFSNGAEGFVGPNSYLMLWSSSQIPELNAAYSVSEFAPELVLFGTNGGGTGYAFNKLDSSLPIVDVPLLGMSKETAACRAATFEEFLEYLYND